MKDTEMPHSAKATKWSNMLTYISVLVIVGTEAYALAIALAWALGGYLELGSEITLVLYGLAFMAATAVMYKFAQMAYGVDESSSG